MITEVNLIGITPEVIQDKDFEKIKDSFESRLDLLILRFKYKKELIYIYIMISLVLFDFDGTFTDGTVYFNENIIIKKYNVIDGMGIKLLKEQNIKVGIITGFKENNSFKEICKHLNVDYYFENVSNKVNILNKLKNELSINESNIAYIGDDINDYDILNLIKIKGCVSTANYKLKNICNFITKNKPGYGAVREFCEYIINYNRFGNLY